jgi:carbon monoxide dehydrogenase subunit G
MKFSGELTVKAPRGAVFDALRDARFFASCVDGVRDPVEIAPDATRRCSRPRLPI